MDPQQVVSKDAPIIMPWFDAHKYLHRYYRQSRVLTQEWRKSLKMLGKHAVGNQKEEIQTFRVHGWRSCIEQFTNFVSGLEVVLNLISLIELVIPFSLVLPHSKCSKASHLHDEKITWLKHVSINIYKYANDLYPWNCTLRNCISDVNKLGSYSRVLKHIVYLYPLRFSCRNIRKWKAAK